MLKISLGFKMHIKELRARIILDSRNEKTIEVFVKTDLGLVSASSPSGKSKGRYEAAPYIKNIEQDIKNLIENSKKISEVEISKFDDLDEIEKIIFKKIGANSLFALESAVLKALALEQGKELWQVINEKAKKFPCPVGNCIGGGLHSRTLNYLKPDFQEFLVIPRKKNFSDNVFLMNKAKNICRERLKLRKALGSLNDENAFSTSLENEEVLDVLNKTREELEQEGGKIDIGIDAASSVFYTGLVYSYKNPVRRLKTEEQLNYIKNLIDNFRLSYVEDPFNDDDFDSFSQLRENIVKERACLIVGDDLIASQLDRLKKSLMKRAANAVIVKPNQVGSLLEIKKLIELAKKYEIVTIFSHRSGETLDYALADFAFGFQTEFVKTGIAGKEREIKLKRLIEIEKSLS